MYGKYIVYVVYKPFKAGPRHAHSPTLTDVFLICTIAIAMLPFRPTKELSDRDPLTHILEKFNSDQPPSNKTSVPETAPPPLNLTKPSSAAQQTRCPK